MKIFWEHGLMNNEMGKSLHVLTGFKGLLRFFFYFLFVFPGFFGVCVGGGGGGCKKKCAVQGGVRKPPR